MTAEEKRILEEVRRLAVQRRVRFSSHALDEMDECDMSKEDVIHTLQSGYDCRPGERPGRWVITGRKLDRDERCVVVVIEINALVVTVW